MNAEGERAIAALVTGLGGAAIALHASSDPLLLLAAAGFLGGSTGLFWPPPLNAAPHHAGGRGRRSADGAGVAKVVAP